MRVQHLRYRERADLGEPVFFEGGFLDRLLDGAKPAGIERLVQLGLKTRVLTQQSFDAIALFLDHSAPERPVFCR
jgi:hypothetical protein